MNKALCAKIGNGAFPSAAMLIRAGIQQLQSECGLGYRAKTLVRLAEQVLPTAVVLSLNAEATCFHKAAYDGEHTLTSR